MTYHSIIAEARKRAGIAQSEMARLAGTSQPAVARLERGLSSPTLSTLERLVRAAGFELRLELVPLPSADPLVEAYKKDVDRTLLRENLRLSVDDRLRALAHWQEFSNELQHAVRVSRMRS